MPEEAVPTWSGDPAEFEHFATACRWYEKSLKESERRQAAPRIWSRLHGAAKAVVRHLNPDEYETAGGLQKLLQVLRDSPLQQLPVPDSFSRLEKWNSLRRRDGETIAELLVREEDLFTQLQQALLRARGDRTGIVGVRGATAAPDADANPSTPSQTGAGGDSPIRGGPRNPVVPPTVPEEPARPVVSHTDFFGDELRGYRLLKAANLSRHEKLNILTQTNNGTQFYAIRRALRTMFAEDHEPQRPVRRGKGIWWQQDVNEDFHGDWQEEDWLQWQEAQQAYWAEWSSPSNSWQDWHDALWASDDWSQWPDDSWGEYAVQVDEIEPNDAAEGPEEAQFREAYALAGEANKTLAQARDAVKQVRMARGYYSPESNSGKGLQSSPSASLVRSGKGYGGKSFGAGKGKAGKFLVLVHASFAIALATAMSTVPIALVVVERALASLVRVQKASPPIFVVWALFRCFGQLKQRAMAATPELWWTPVPQRMQLVRHHCRSCLPTAISCTVFAWMIGRLFASAMDKDRGQQVELTSRGLRWEPFRSMSWLVKKLNRPLLCWVHLR